MKKENTIKIIIVVLVVICVLGVFIFKSIEKSNIKKSENNNNSISSTDIKKETEVSMYSDEKSLPTLLDFGATTCEPCKIMFPILDKIEKQYEGRITVKFINVYSDFKNMQKYDIRTIPTQIFLDSQGEIVYTHEGVLYEDEIIAQLIEMGVK